MPNPEGPGLEQPKVNSADLPDLVVMAMASRRRARILTRDFRHFRSVVLRRGHHWPLVVDESELPKPWFKDPDGDILNFINM